MLHKRRASEQKDTTDFRNNLTRQSAYAMTESQGNDDVDIFISPRRFGGRTPCAQATMQKVFEEQRAKSEGQSTEKDEDTFEGVRYRYDSSGGE